MIAVYKAIGAVSQELSAQGISKDRNNAAQGYKFRGIDDVLNALSGALVKAGLVILPRCMSRDVVERTTGNGKALFYVTCQVEFDLVSTEDGSKHTVCTYGEAMDSADKATNKAMSAAYKYLALLVFCIPTEASQETDADFSTHDVAASRAPVIASPEGDTSPKARAMRLMVGVSSGDAVGAAAAIASWDQALINEVWKHLDDKSASAINANWPKA